MVENLFLKLVLSQWKLKIHFSNNDIKTAPVFPCMMGCIDCTHIDIAWPHFKGATYVLQLQSLPFYKCPN
ncbi:hypothetical protein PR048_028599, partial [Dryococelus australis]